MSDATATIEPKNEGVPAAGRPSESPSPVMAQYLELKRAYPDALLFYRMGDFYELFFEDAVRAAAALDIALTKRGRYDGQDIPMCGVPVHTVDSYLARLIRKGFRVAICEQLETPEEARKRGAKAVLRRDVVRLVTSGTLTEDALLDPRRNNFLVAIADAQGARAIATADMSTGTFELRPLASDSLRAVLAELGAGELVGAERLLADAEIRAAAEEAGFAVAALTGPVPDSEAARRRLQAHYRVTTLDGFGDFGRAELAAAGALFLYLETTQRGKLPRLAPPARVIGATRLEIDPATRRNLELEVTLTGDRSGSLLATIDRTATAAGARLLAARLAAPLTDAGAIRSRLDAVEFFVMRPEPRRRVRHLLRGVPDIERALSRLSLGRGSPRDLGNLRDALAAAGELNREFRHPELAPLPAPLRKCTDELHGEGALQDLLQQALGAALPFHAQDGGFIAAGYAEDLDSLRELRDESRRLVANLQARYAGESGIAGLKIRHNNVIGYHIEVTPVHADKLMAGGSGRFIHRQTLANAVRFTTTELADLESKVHRAADDALRRELGIFAELCAASLARAERLAALALAIAELDLASSLADLGVERRWCRPDVVEGRDFAIAAGRHPVVEAALDRRALPFVPNDADMGPDRHLWLVTGPNMAGKSTFLRQNALLVILAQMGSYVPAQSARIGVVDRLFTRVGAADDLARGRSTFMVEMVETALILHRASEKSFVVLDEIGRGTATFDGLSIAWATVEHLHAVNRSRTLFATHYHELTALAAKLPRLACHTMRVKEWKGEVVFLHEVAAGTADRSYGVHVAELAGLPRAVTERAREILTLLEKGEQAGALARLADDLPLFRARAAGAAPSHSTSAVEAALAEIEPDRLSPKEALEHLYRLKGLTSQDQG
jgi:DNA mismatch repair protein MutS